MKKTLSLILVTFVTIPTVFAESSFPIGDDVFLLEHPQNEYPVHFQNFVAEDVALDYWTESVCGTPCLMAAAKTATKDVMGLNLDPIFWIYWNGSWRFCHPAILRNLQTGK